MKDQRIAEQSSDTRITSGQSMNARRIPGRSTNARSISSKGSNVRRPLKPAASGSRHSGQGAGRRNPPDYGTYQFSRRELAGNILIFMLLDGVIAFLFYRSVIAFLILLPVVVPFLKARRKDLGDRRSKEILAQFTTGMQLVNASLQAGYAIENSFREAISELRKIYPDGSFIIYEFRYIISQTGLNVPIETLLLDLGRRSHIEDIRNFAEVFQTAKRTGGDMIAIIRNAVSSIQMKKETREAIEANLSGKASEQKIMSAAPILLIAYTSISSPGFLDVCYHNTLGITIMTASLAVYAAAFLWGRKIMQIEI
jgi:tight adherence protein B